MNTHDMGRLYRRCPTCKARRTKPCVTLSYGDEYSNGYVHVARRQPFITLWNKAFAAGRRYEKRQAGYIPV
jgi:hypothetical protein